MPAVSYDIEFAGDLPPAVRDALAARIQTTLPGGVSGRDAHGVELTYGVIDDGASQTGDDAFQIVILSDGLAVHIPYWYEGDDARRVLRRVWRVLEVAQQTLSAVPFDPQLDRALDLDRDFREVVAAYGGAVDFTAALVRGSQDPGQHHRTDVTGLTTQSGTSASVVRRSPAWLAAVLVFEALVVGGLIATGETAPEYFIIPVVVAVWAVWRTLPR